MGNILITEGSKRDLSSIQYLRGIAAMMVTLAHTDFQLSRMGVEFGLEKLASGVDIFFIISGLIMWISTSRSPERTAFQFFRDRIVRIVPLYWGVTFAIAGFAVVAPRLMQSTQFDVPLLVASLFFVAWPNPLTGGYEPLVVVGWTLNLEMFFYLLFALAMIFTRDLASRFALLVGLIVAAVATMSLLPALPGALRFYGNNIILEFAFGLGLGWVWLNRRPVVGPVWWVVCLTGFALLLIQPFPASTPHALSIGIPATLVVAGAVFAPPFRSALFLLLGDSSYSLYLSHAIVLSALAQVWRRVDLSALPLLVFLLVAIGTTVLAGWIVYRVVEVPITAFAVRLLRQEKRLPRASAS
jgi:peptidoglycan/LPS O-acetylase OafA/YrhL